MRILFATDGSEEARGAIEFLRALPWPEGTAIDVLVVVSPLGGSTYLAADAPERIRAAEREWADQVLTEAKAALQLPGVSVGTTVRDGNPAHQILLAAQELRADLIALGSKGLTGLAGFLLGSVARNVAKHADRPVLVARAPKHGLRRAVVAVDGSEHSDRAVDLLVDLPPPPKLELVVVHVVRPFDPPPPALFRYPEEFMTDVDAVRREREADARDILEAASALLAEHGRKVSTLAPAGNPSEALLALAAEQEADLIVAGARGTSPIDRLIVGSVADRLLKAAECSVLIVH